MFLGLSFRAVFFYLEGLSPRSSNCNWCTYLFRRLDAKEYTEKTKKLKENENRIKEIKILSEDRKKLRISRKTETEMNRNKKLSNRLPKSSKKHYEKLEEKII